MTTLTKSTSYGYVYKATTHPGTPGTPAYSYTYSVTAPVYGYVDTSVYTNDGVTNIGDNSGSVGGSTPTVGGYTYKTTNYTVNVPAVPATAPYVTYGLVYSLILNTGWNSFARTIDSLLTDGRLEFVPNPNATGVVVGLNISDPSADYAAVPWGLYITNGTVQPIENGVLQSSAQSLTGLLSIQRRGTTIDYYRGTSLMYTSLKAVPAGVGLIGSANMYQGTDSVGTADYSTTLYGSQGATASMQTVNALASDTAYGTASTSMLPATTSISGAMLVGVRAVMQLVSSLAADRAYGTSTASMLPATTSLGLGALAPVSVGVEAIMAYMGVSSIMYVGVAGGADVTMQLAGTLAADRSYGQAINSMLPARSVSYQFAKLNAVADLTLTGKITMKGSVTSSDPATFQGTIGFTFSAFTGDAAKLKAPAYDLLATGTNVSLARGKMTLPMITMSASSTVGGVGKAAMQFYDGYSLSAFTGDIAQTKLAGAYQLDFTIGSGGVSRFMGKLPMPTLVAGIVTESTASADITLPMIVIAGSGVARIAMPMGKVIGLMSEDVVVTYEAYAINMLSKIDAASNVVQHNEVTHYTEFPFNQIVRFKDDYYGVADDGLYLLGGDTDAGAPIAWEWKTTLTDFQSKQKKRVSSGYAGGRVTKGMTMTVFLGEGDSYAYPFETVRGDDAQNYRVKFGRGTKSRYYAFGMSDAQGRDIEISSLDIEVNELERGI